VSHRSAFSFNVGESEATQNFSCLYPITCYTLGGRN